MKKRILFILKKGNAYGQGHYKHTRSGLLNSAVFVVEMLNANGFKAWAVEVIDNNDIDREVAKHNPDIVILEALWVVPEKFDILVALHSKVQWIIRIHSEAAFLAQEGIAADWIFGYLSQPNVYVAFNSLRAAADFEKISHSEKVIYLPNYAPEKNTSKKKTKTSEFLEVGCFGAIRPLKNQLGQAIAAIHFADNRNKVVRFHINADRVEGGEAVLKNLRMLFANTPHQLVEHEWMSHGAFCELIQTMDVMMCVSLSETFCIVASDAARLEIPLVVSPAIPWAAHVSKAHPTDTESIVERMEFVYNHQKHCTMANQAALHEYNEDSIRVWTEFLNG